MELAVRLSGALPAPTTGPGGAGLVVAAVCAAALLAVGLAHYAGAGARIVEVWLLSPFTGLALAWLGGGSLLVLGASLLASLPGVAALAGTVVLALSGVAAWVVGVVGLVWLPARLRPLWLRRRLADPAFVARGRWPRRDRRRRP